MVAPRLVNVVQAVDNTFLLIFGLSALLLLGITVAMIWFVIRYSRKNNPTPATFSGNFWAELIWILAPTLLVMGMFYSGWHSYRALRDAPPGAMQVKVLAHMWAWDFEYANGRHSPELVVPVGVPVGLSVTSSDVLHGFFAPAFRIKIDAVPGMTNHAWFRADKAGEYVIFCSVYCGVGHAKMLSAIKAVSQEEFDRFMAGKPAASKPDGRAIAEAQGCLGCHSLDGSVIVGPSFKGLFGTKSLAKDGAPVDRAFVAALLHDPAARLGKATMMPAYPALTAADREALVNFLESLGVKPGSAGQGTAGGGRP
ncbi:MAG: cytochrome c oxidase subunit II [Humidesulfovibrio sp.]|nr:cytochrome c oxidase subunit II [Humidesulfovibrio sp.]